MIVLNMVELVMSPIEVCLSDLKECIFHTMTISTCELRQLPKNTLRLVPCECMHVPDMQAR